MPNILSQQYQATELDSNVFIENLHGDHIEHHGVKNQKWYKRLFQYKDGSLTPLGRIHYGVGPARGKSQNKVTSDENKESKYSRKNVEDMTDQEVQQYIQRLRNEAEIKRLTKEASKGSVRKFLDQNAKQGFNRAMNNVVEKAVDKAFNGFFKDAKEVKYSDILNEEKAKLSLEVIRGNKDAATRLSNLTKASKGKMDEFENLETRAEAAKRKAQEKRDDREAMAEAKKIEKEEKETRKAERQEKRKAVKDAFNKTFKNKKYEPKHMKPSNQSKQPKHMKHSEEFLEDFIKMSAAGISFDAKDNIGG